MDYNKLNIEIKEFIQKRRDEYQKEKNKIGKCITSPIKCMLKSVKLIQNNGYEYKRLMKYYSPYKDLANIVYYENVLNENKE